MMEQHKLYEVLFGMDNLPVELKYGINRKALIEYLETIISFSHHAHPRHLLSAGQIAEHIYFVEKGMVRGYYYDKKKEAEHTVILWDELSIFTEPSSLFKNTASGLSIEVMAGSHLLSISHQQLKALYLAFPYIEPFTGCISLQYTSSFVKRCYDLVCLSAWDRYLDMISTYPGIEQKISKEMIASYIGIAPQSLSRLLKENGHP
jgi:CRP-like cAMP-binding protein